MDIYIYLEMGCLFRRPSLFILDISKKKRKWEEASCNMNKALLELPDRRQHGNGKEAIWVRRIISLVDRYLQGQAPWLPKLLGRTIVHSLAFLAVNKRNASQLGSINHDRCRNFYFCSLYHIQVGFLNSLLPKLFFVFIIIWKFVDNLKSIESIALCESCCCCTR